MNILRAMAIIFVFLATGAVQASDWPQYLGPHRNAVSDETGLLRSWPADGPEVLWTVPLGEGFGGPAVSGGKVYVFDRVDDKENVLRCLDLTTGKEEWTFSYESPGSVSYDGSRAVPTVDGDRIYVCGLFGNLHCVDKNTHQAIWHKNIWTDFGGGDVPRWAITQNPLIYRNMVIVASQTGDAGVVAYDKMTGELLWKTDKLPGEAGYVSPAIVKISGEDHVVMVSAKGRGSGGGRPPAGRGAQGGAPPAGQSPPGGAETAGPPAGQGPPAGSENAGPPAGEGARGGAPAAAAADSGTPGAITGYDPETGALLWTYEGWQCSIPIPNVAELGDNRLFITGGYNAGGAIFEVEKNGNSYATREVMTSEKFGTHVHPAILYEGHLYGHCSNNDVRDGFVCMDLEGNVKWETGRKPLFDKGGFILADGLLISSDGEKALYLIEPTPTEFKVLAEAELLDTKQSWAPLALSDGKLLIRDQKQMKCVVVK